jgi:predicted RNA-binding Zn-ribbon protein involved in translation (DUF1610 family)
VKDYNYILQDQCPQCGAEIILSDTQRVIICPYCRVHLYISFLDFPTFYLPCPKDIEAKCVYVPYWRCRGTKYYFENGKIKNTLIDNSFCAVRDLPFDAPYSCGIKSQICKLKFIDMSDNGIYLPPQIPIKEVKSIFMKSLQKQNEFLKAIFSLNHKKDIQYESQQFLDVLIGEIISLIYFPFYIEKKEVFDAITRIKICNLQNDLPAFENFKPYPPAFVSTLCPECGWQLYAKEESLVLICNNCGIGYQIDKSNFNRVQYYIFNSIKKADLLLPFWCIKVYEKNNKLQTYNDFIKFTRQPFNLVKSDENKEFFLWFPAFKTNPSLFVLLSKLLTLNQLELKDARENIPKNSNFYPINLHQQEAFEASKIVLAELKQDKKNLYNEITKLELSLLSYKIVYIPFEQKGFEYFNPMLKLSIMANALKWGMNI